MSYPWQGASRMQAKILDFEGLDDSIMNYFSQGDVNAWPVSEDFKAAWKCARRDLLLIQDELLKMTEDAAPQLAREGEGVVGGR